MVGAFCYLQTDKQVEDNMNKQKEKLPPYNITLAEERGLDIPKMNLLYKDLWHTLSKDHDTTDKVEVSRVNDYIKELEFLLQEEWGFDRDANYHSYWYQVKGCSCPKLDNADAVGSGMFWTSLSCPFHGLINVGEKSSIVGDPEVTPKVVIFNGAAYSGKDHICEFLKDHIECWGLSFKEKLVSLTQSIYSVSAEEWDSHYSRDLKEKTWDKLEGLSPRQALIKVSEEVIKPNFGKDYFGKALVKKVEEGVSKGYKLFVCSDGGFVEELKPLTSKYGSGNVLVVRIHREGCSFEGDSRNHLPDSEDYSTIDITNKGDHTFEEDVMKLVKPFKES